MQPRQLQSFLEKCDASQAPLKRCTEPVTTGEFADQGTWAPDPAKSNLTTSSEPCYYQAFTKPEMMGCLSGNGGGTLNAPGSWTLVMGGSNAIAYMLTLINQFSPRKPHVVMFAFIVVELDLGLE